MQIDTDLHLDLLVASVFKRSYFSDFKMTNFWLDHWHVTIVLRFYGKIISSVKCENFGEGDLMEFWENDHVSGV